MQDFKNSRNNPKVSIIIPIYNIYHYLPQCINSVIGQTYRNIEIILIDDGSNDGSEKICDEYLEIDKRIKTIHKVNGGLSDARNVGIKYAVGAWLFFLDGDDAIDPMTIEIMVELALRYDVSMVGTGLLQFAARVPNCEHYLREGQVLEHDELLKRTFLHQGIGHEACGKLFQKKIWNDLRFPLGLLYEDYATIYKAISLCNRAVIALDKMYYYRTRPGSIMNSKLGKKELQILDIAQSVTDYISINDTDYKMYAEYLQVVTYLKTMQKILEEGENQYQDEQKKIVQYVGKHRWLLKQNWVKCVDKIKMLTLLINKKLFYISYKVSDYFKFIKMKILCSD